MLHEIVGEFCRFCGRTPTEIMANCPNHCDARQIADIGPEARVQALEAQVAQLESELRQLRMSVRGPYFTLASCLHLRGKELFGANRHLVHEMLEDLRLRIGWPDLDQQQTTREPANDQS